MPGQSQLSTPQKARIVGLLAGGTSLRETASAVGASRSAVHRFSCRAEVRRRIEAQVDRLIEEGLADAIAVTLAPIKRAADLYTQAEKAEAEEPGAGRELLKGSIPILKLADQAAARLLSTAGLSSSPAVGPALGPVFIDARQQLISPVVAQLLGGAERLSRILGGDQAETS